VGLAEPNIPLFGKKFQKLWPDQQPLHDDSVIEKKKDIIRELDNRRI
jgi:hypothetical protein